MNCIEARRMVTPFVEKELSEKEAEQFLRHVEHCDDCMDELDIYYTIYKALDLLDSSEHKEYDFKKMLQEELKTTKRTIVTRKTFRITRRCILIFTELLLLISVYVGYQMHMGEPIPLHHRILQGFQRNVEETENLSLIQIEEQTKVPITNK